jgi:nucleoside-diphosphate-sugar epimerase
MAARSWDTAVWVADPRAAADALGWSAVTTLADGLRAIADWMLADPEHRAAYR